MRSKGSVSNRQPSDDSDPDMDKTIYCLCGTTYDPNIFMIQCDLCKDWFHGSCCNFHEYTAIEIEKYHCPRCQVTFGPSVYKPFLSAHRHDYWDPNAAQKATQTGTPAFVHELGARHFNNDSEVVIHMSGHQLTDTLLLQQGFNNPIVIDNPEGLDMKIPTSNFSLYDVEAYIGGDVEIDVIDVTRQADIKMKLRDFVGYYNSLNRRRIFNVISLEVSNTSLGRLVEAPAIARKLDWANIMWPKDYFIPSPQVQKYCLMSVKDSYTDFHIDFGGTSVWYHVLRGEKIFYFIQPSSANLMLYQQWMTSTNQSEMFFGDQVDRCYKCILNEGQTMFIPTGWIHAVYTPTDSLVFGGNFLHSLNISMQMQVYDIEKQIKLAEKFKYPNFECMNWFAAQNMYLTLKDINAEEVRCPDVLLNCLKNIIVSLKRWVNRKYQYYYGKAQVPEGLNHSKLLKDIGKEIRHAEKYIHSIEPPKPERESTRTRKRPANLDFFDYSLSRSFDYIPLLKCEQHLRVPPLKLTLPKPSTYPYKASASRRKRIVSTQEVTTSSRPAVTTAVHRGGAVLQFRLGTKDYFPRTQSNEVSSTSTSSVYDFHDDSEHEETAMILPVKKPKKALKKQRSKKQRRPSVNQSRLKSEIQEKESTAKDEESFDDLKSRTVVIPEAVDNNDFTSDDYCDPIVVDNSSDPGDSSDPNDSNDSSYPIDTSDPSDSSDPEFSDVFHNTDTADSTVSFPDTTVPSVSYAYGTAHPDDENFSKVHQDDDYIYPSLDNSDDDDVQIFKPRGRSRIDEPWSPKARVGPLLPKINRPTREGTKKQAVEKVLEAAAAKRATEVEEKSPKRQYRKRKPKSVVENKKSAAQPGPSTSTCTVTSASTSTATSSATSNASSAASSTPTPPSPVVKQKKGMKTVKQRLGKILKLHKMMH